MGMDISYHPVDLALIESRIIPYLQGKGSIDDLVDRAAKIARVRFQANAWGLGAMENEKVDSDLHVWGRPFLITDEAPEDVSAAIDRWLETSEADADGVGKQMLSRAGIQGARKSEEGELPPDRDLKRSLRWTLDLLRESYAAFTTGKKVVSGPDGQKHNPGVLLAREIPMRVLEFSAHFRPGWMARGEAWPSLLLEKAKLPAAEFFEDPRDLMGPLYADLSKKLDLFLEPTLVENYMVGGWVRAERVAPLRRLLADKSAAILDANDDGEGGSYIRICLRKIDEALADAQRRGLPFAEATEIYSGPMGIMN